MASLAIIGLGLIGGSIAAGLKKNNSDYAVMAWDSNRDSLERGFSRGLIDTILDDPAEIDADLVVLAVPLAALEEFLPRVKFGDSIITDVCSVKSHVLDIFKKVIGTVPLKFVPGHPIAGSEQHGLAASDADLFAGHRVILTPLADTDASSTSKVAGMWQELGATVSYMTAEHHDQILAQTSHLPHLLAYALVDTLSLDGDSLEVFQYAAGGFRDFSRIAASDPVMWKDIFLSNSDPIVGVLDRYGEELVRLRQLIIEGDGEQLEAIFGRAKVARDYFSEITKQND